MGFLDLGMDDEAERERARLEQERLARRQAAQGEAASVVDDPATLEALRGLQGAPPVAPPGRPGEAAETMAEAAPAPVPEEARARVTRVEERLRQPGGPAGVEADVMAGRDADPGVPELQPERAPATEAMVPARAPRAMERSAGPSARDLASPIDAAMRAKPRERPIPTGAGALDAGLPSEEEIRRAGDADNYRRMARAIGALLGGNVSPQWTPEEERLRQRRDIGMRERMAGKRQAREDEQGAIIQQAQLGERAEDRALRSRELDIRQADAEERRRIGAAELQRTLDERAQRTRADSAISEAYRTTLRQRIDTYRATGNSALADSLERIHGQSLADGTATAEQLEPVLGRTGGLPQVHMRGRAGGGGAGGIPGQPPGVSVVGDVQVDDLVSRGRLTEEQGASLRAALQSGNRRIRDEAQRQVRTLMPGQGETREVMPGLSVDLDIPNGEATSLRRQFGDVASSWSTLGRVRALAQQYGARAVLDPEAVRRIETEMVPLRAMVARIQNTGVINPGERPLIDAVLPDPSSFTGQALGTFAAALDQWERQALSDIDARFIPYVQDERMEEVRSYLRRRLSGSRGAVGSRAAAATQQYQVYDANGRAIGAPRALRQDQIDALTGSGHRVEAVR